MTFHWQAADEALWGSHPITGASIKHLLVAL
jgi:hypothetical protein